MGGARSRFFIKIKAVSAKIYSAYYKLALTKAVQSNAIEVEFCGNETEKNNYL